VNALIAGFARSVMRSQDVVVWEWGCCWERFASFVGGIEGGQSRAFQLVHGPQTPFLARSRNHPHGIQHQPLLRAGHIVKPSKESISIEELSLHFSNIYTFGNLKQVKGVSGSWDSQ
jgi:hypothetical protein